MLSKTNNDIAAALDTAVTENGTPLMDLVEASPVLLVFLRHAGCTFCREALSDLASVRGRIEASGTRILLVYMGDAAMKAMVERYKVGDLERILDPNRALYGAFGLRNGTIWQLFGPKVWLRGLLSGLLFRHGIGFPVADFRQMPGVFYIRKSSIAGRFRHRSSSDRPPYAELCGRTVFG